MGAGERPLGVLDEEEGIMFSAGAQVNGPGKFGTIDGNGGMGFVLCASVVRRQQARVLSIIFYSTRRGPITKKWNRRERVLRELAPLHHRELLRDKRTTFQYVVSRLDATTVNMLY